MRKLLMIVLLVGLFNFAFAATFDTGTTGGTVSVPGDYASLKLAADAFNALAGGINANWTIEITSDLTEPDNVAFGNLTNGKTLTIKPAATKTPTITFTAITAAGIYGHLVFGVSQVTGNPLEAEYFETVNGYVIDGNNGGTPGERNMTLTNTSGSITGRIISIFGKTDGVIIKNARIIQEDITGTTWCIRWAGGSLGTKTNIAADGGTVENCELTANLNPAGVAISFSPGANAPELAAGYAFNNMHFLNNDINASQRGIFLDSVANVTIIGNKITLTGRNGYTTVGIFDWDANDYNPYTITIEDNVLDITTPNASATNGTMGILVDTLTDLTNNGTVNIDNNIFKNFAFTTTTPIDQSYAGIYLARPRVTYNLEHNSVNMPSSSMVTGETAGKCAAIVVTSSAGTSPVNLQNNLIRLEQTGTGVNLVYAPGGVLTAAGDDMVSAGGATMGIVGVNTYADFAAWQVAVYDTTASGGQSVDPNTTVPSWDSDLKFNTFGLPSPMIGVASSTVLTDIDGEARPATGATPGADEPLVPTPTPTPIPLSCNPGWGLYE
jgi:hypothetical protein